MQMPTMTSSTRPVIEALLWDVSASEWVPTDVATQAELDAHMIAHTSDPGAASKPLSTDGSGYLNLVRLYLDELHAETGADLTIQLGDDAGAQKLVIKDSGAAEVASLDSDGLLKLSGSATDYATFAVAADGTLTITTVDADATADIILMPDGNVGIGTPDPAGLLHVEGLAESGVQEENIFIVTLSDAPGAYFKVSNATSANGVFVPRFMGRANSTLMSLSLMAFVNDAHDTGTTPAMFFDARKDSGALVTRPTFRFRSAANNFLEILANGNIGINTLSPDAKLDVHGDTRLGDSDDGDYLNVSSVGVITLVGSARVTRDLWIDAAGIKAPGAKPATEVAFGTLEVSAWEFSNEAVEANQESVSWRIAIPYDMDRSAGPVIRLGWSSASTGNCKWQLKYRWFSEDEDLTQDGEETLTAIDAASATANGLVVTDITGIDAPSGTDATIMFKLTRLSADAADTIADSVELHGVCFNYTSDKLGEAI